VAKITSKFNPELMGAIVRRRIGAGTLNELSSSEDSQGKDHAIPAELVVRESTGPASPPTD